MELLKILCKDRYLRSSVPVEIHSTGKGVLAESFPYSSIYYLEYNTLVLELDFRLGRVYVDIDRVRIHLKIKEI